MWSSLENPSVVSPQPREQLDYSLSANSQAALLSNMVHFDAKDRRQVTRTRR
jgi:hypothetical protein